MNKIKLILLEIFIDTQYIFLNYIVNHIPCWFIRKLFYKLNGLSIGKHSRIYMGCKVLSPNNIKIGNYCVINECSFLDGRGGLTIGDNVSISVFTMILTASHDKNSKDFHYISAPVVLKDRTWTGARALILDNSVLEYGSIVGAGSVFKGKSEKNSLYVGIPAKKIGNRREECNYILDFEPFFR